MCVMYESFEYTIVYKVTSKENGWFANDPQECNHCA